MHSKDIVTIVALICWLLLVSHKAVSDYLQPHWPQDARFPSFIISWTLLKLMSISLVMLSNHLILCLPLLPLPSIFPSIGVFSSKSALRIRWPKYWSFSFNNNPSNEYSALISFRIDWSDLSMKSKGLSRVFSSTYWSVFQHFFSYIKAAPGLPCAYILVLTWLLCSQALKAWFVDPCLWANHVTDLASTSSSKEGRNHLLAS